MCFNFLEKTYHRYLLERMLKQNASLIKGKILDVGSRNRRYDKLFEGEVIACDIAPSQKLGIEKQDLTRLSYPENSFDSIICLEVLEYLRLENLSQGLSEIHRVLKPGGIALITCPFYYKDHGDNMRLSLTYLNEVLSQLAFREHRVHTIGNRHTAIFDAIRFPFLKRTAGRKFKKILLSFYYVPKLLLRLGFIKLFALERSRDDFYSGLFVVLKK